MSTKRSFPEWVRYRVSRIPRKLAFARHRLLWIWKDIANGIRIWWEVRLWKRPLADITRYERRIWSENGEDGILEAIFMAVGTTNKTFVEFGSGDLHECNTRYLATWKGWRGLWMDAMYIDQSHRVKRERVTAENIEALFAKYHIPKAFDFIVY